MKKNISILIFEKEKILKSILEDQILNYQITFEDDNENLFKTVNEHFFDLAIVNLDEIKDNIIDFITVFNDKNKNKYLILYHDKLFNHIIDIEYDNIIYIIKPFKLTTLINHMNDILKNKEKSKTKIYLMKHLIFYPAKKIIHNNKTNLKEHLTEKETNLLEYFIKNKNSKIHKKDLLTTIWAINENINTHTLETHIYRIRQKLYKLEQNPSFHLKNEKGKYFFKDNI